MFQDLKKKKLKFKVLYEKLYLCTMYVCNLHILFRRNSALYLSVLAAAVVFELVIFLNIS